MAPSSEIGGVSSAAFGTANEYDDKCSGEKKTPKDLAHKDFGRLARRPLCIFYIILWGRLARRPEKSLCLGVFLFPYLW